MIFTTLPILVASLIAPPEAIAIPNYKPSLHGFHFVNSFSGSSLPAPLDTLAKAVGGIGPNHFGLCGGMSFASLDFFLAKRPIPGTSAIPKHGTPLYDWIYKRQVASFGLGFPMVSRFADAMAAPDNGPNGTRFASLPQVFSVRHEIAAGRPAVLGLVLVSNREHRQLWENHQVLAYSWSRVPGELVAWRIGIYDPNYPRNDAVVLEARCAMVGSLCGLAPVPLPALGVVSRRAVPATPVSPARPSTPVRGFFVMPYEAKTPPGDL